MNNEILEAEVTGPETGMTPYVTIANGKPVTTSLAVAKAYGKKHKHVLDAIRNFLDNCPESFSGPNFRPADLPAEWGVLNFEHTQIVNLA